jgi:hypothetical protein
MTELTDKEKTIKKIYYNVVSGYGSKRDTYLQANKIDSSIRYVDVKEYLDAKPHKQTQFKYSGSNSFVSPHALFEIEVDLIDLTAKAEENDGYRYCMVGIDNFTKYAWGVAIKTKKPVDVVSAMEKILSKIGIPKQLYSDQEGAFNNVEFIKLMNKNKIKHIMVVDGAHTIERFNRTLKENIQTRLDAMELDRYKWVSQLEPIIDKYNNTKHSTIKMSPNDAKNGSNHLTVSYNIWDGAKRNRKYPDIKVGDDVRVIIKKDNKTKGYFPKWSVDKYTITFINKDNEYVINDNKKNYIYVMSC